MSQENSALAADKKPRSLYDFLLKSDGAISLLVIVLGFLFATIFFLMNSIAPTSRPRVGWAKIKSDASMLSSRAMMSFCWFPPDMAPASAPPSPPRMSNASDKASPFFCMAALSKKIPFLTNFL